MSLDKQQTNKQCRAGRDVAGLDGKGAAEGAKGSQQNLFHITEFDSKTNVTNMPHTIANPPHIRLRCFTIGNLPHIYKTKMRNRRWK